MKDIKALEDAIQNILQHFPGGVSSERLFNNVVRDVGTVADPVELDAYQSALSTLETRGTIIRKKVMVEGYAYGSLEPAMGYMLSN